jgi:hypothetical protein
LKVPGSLYGAAQKQQLVAKATVWRMESGLVAWKCGKLDVETSVGDLEKTDDPAGVG